MIRSYRLSGELCLENFGDESILLVADWDRLLTIDRSAAELFELLLRELGDSPFSRVDLSRLLCKHYDLSETDAVAETSRILGFGLRQGIVKKGQE